MGVVQILINNHRTLISQLTNQQLESAVARIRESKPYLVFFQQLIGADINQFLNNLYTFNFLSCVDTENPKQSYIENCLKRPIVMLDVNEQMTRFFFLDIEYSLIIRERFSRNF